MKDLADEQSGFYREIGVLLRPTTGTCLGRVPCGKRLFGEPDRDIATLAQGFVIFEPVGHFVTRFLDLVTAALRSEENTSELQSHLNIVCRLLLQKKKLSSVQMT